MTETTGSSPLARGLPGVGLHHLDKRRIIPARAGFTRRSSSCSTPCRDHPRSRGVYEAWPSFKPRCLGSSPLARGLRTDASPSSASVRIIPARAGFTAASASRPRQRTDHPRSRGVYACQRARLSGEVGSSPLARGLHRPRPSGRTAAGIIPARAGFTSGGAARSAPPPDHPRSRGVYAPSGCGVVSAWGSSPLARGLPVRAPQSVALARIIPARAGFTSRPTRPRLSRTDHPRSRGVYTFMMPSIVMHSGSSPLARGLQDDVVCPRGWRGIIPARAGFTTDFPTFALTNKDHPRSRGVYTINCTTVNSLKGSSPLARGLPDAVVYW